MMRRRRWLQPNFFRSEDVSSLPYAARLTFEGLWCSADDYGRMRLNPALIKADVWPLDDEVTADVILEHLFLMDARGMIVFYTVDGRDYLWISGWDEHQPVKNPSRSDLPAPPAYQSRPDDENKPKMPYVESTPNGSSEGERRDGVERAETEGVRVERERALGETERDVSETLPPSPFCVKHPEGTDYPCVPCGRARKRFDYWKELRRLRD